MCTVHMSFTCICDCVGYTSKVAVVSTRAEDISSAVLLLIDDDDHTLATVELSKCGENSLIGSLTAPLGFVTYRLEGNDEDGIPFVYGTRRTATFSEGGYVFTTLGEVDVGIEESDSLILLYRIQNTDVQGYASLEFTAVAESSGQYSISVEPEYAVLEAGMSIDVTVSAVANSSTVEPGTGAILFVSASDGCASVTSEFYNVTIKVWFVHSRQVALIDPIPSLFISPQSSQAVTLMGVILF